MGNILLRERPAQRPFSTKGERYWEVTDYFYFQLLDELPKRVVADRGAGEKWNRKPTTNFKATQNNLLSK